MNDSIADILKWMASHKYLFVTLAFIAIIVVFDENNLLKHIQNQREIAILKSDIEELVEQQVEMEKKLRELDTDVHVMEKVAREKYDMQLDNEDVFILED